MKRCFLLALGNYFKKLHKRNIHVVCLTLCLLIYFGVATNSITCAEESIQWNANNNQTITSNYKFKKITLKKIIHGNIDFSANFSDFELIALFSNATKDIPGMHFNITRVIGGGDSQIGICLGKWNSDDAAKPAQHENLINVKNNKFNYYIYDDSKNNFDILTNTLTIAIIVDGKSLSVSSDPDPVIDTKQYKYNITEDNVPANYISSAALSE